ncbi:uncharacterized protein BDV14DRAFT_199993 [Aspergillus stella-maris]|uniref:uncharacterized protein n=1 Tax=Aspergillus stella-maris TaxID=1810926 RepID=UPI003CCD6819
MSSPQPLPQGTRISERAFLIVQWSFTAVASLFVIGRLGIRFSLYRRLFLDDFLVIFAWATLLSTTTIWQIKATLLYRFYEVKPWPPEFYAQYMDFTRYYVVFGLLFYTGLWSVKISVLAFFRKLGSKIRSHRIWWWVVLGLTVALGIVAIGIQVYQGSLRNGHWTESYSSSTTRVRQQNPNFYTQCVCDLVSDLLILSIPILIIWPIKMPLRKKIVLLILFSMTLLIMAVAIIRVAVNTSSDRTLDITWLNLWCSVEVATAIMVACVASFRQLFVTIQNHDSYSSSARNMGSGSENRSNTTPIRMSNLGFMRALSRKASRGSSSRGSERRLRQESSVSLGVVNVEHEPGNVVAVSRDLAGNRGNQSEEPSHRREDD